MRSQERALSSVMVLQIILIGLQRLTLVLIIRYPCRLPRLNSGRA
jgi:hypothetical protein